MIRRAWLNRSGHYSLAMVYAKVEDKEVELKIADCDRTISLAFDSYDERQRSNALYKIDKLVAVLLEFQKALHEEYE